MLVGACSPAESSVVDPVNIPEPVVSVTSMPEPVATPRPPVYPHPEPVPTPMPEYSQAVQVTAEIVRDRCEQYRGIVEQVYEEYPVDPSLVLAVMAQESACMRFSVSDDGHHTIGLMQIAVKPWTPSEYELYNVRINIEWGMYLLHSAVNHPEENPNRDIHRALAAYNCGWTSLNAGKCLYFGGPAYADKVLNFWLPFFEENK